jgi:hypothetical protein
MHAAFLGGFAAPAHARAEPFLLLGVTLGASFSYIAPPPAAAAAARAALGAACAAFLAAFAAAARRDGLAIPGPVAVIPMALLVHCIGAWLRREGRAARVLWLLDGGGSGRRCGRRCGTSCPSKRWRG